MSQELSREEDEMEHKLPERRGKCKVHEDVDIDFSKTCGECFHNSIYDSAIDQFTAYLKAMDKGEGLENLDRDAVIKEVNDCLSSDCVSAFLGIENGDGIEKASEFIGNAIIAKLSPKIPTVDDIFQALGPTTTVDEWDMQMVKAQAIHELWEKK